MASLEKHATQKQICLNATTLMWMEKSEAENHIWPKTYFTLTSLGSLAENPICSFWKATLFPHGSMLWYSVFWKQHVAFYDKLRRRDNMAGIANAISNHIRFYENNRILIPSSPNRPERNKPAAVQTNTVYWCTSKWKASLNPFWMKIIHSCKHLVAISITP